MLKNFKSLLKLLLFFGLANNMCNAFTSTLPMSTKTRNINHKNTCITQMSLNRRDILLKILLIFNIPFLNKIAANAYTEDEEKYIKLFEKLTPSVCYISTEYKDIANKLSINSTNIPKGVGTGFIWDKEGHIVTNFHVINKVDNAQITLTNKEGITKDFFAKLTGVDPDRDIAVIKVDAAYTDLFPITVGLNQNIKIGQYAFAIGNPFGQDHTFTMGIVSGKNRELTSPTGRKIKNVIQTDASINPGNSGGPLLDFDGKLIGMNTATFGMGVSSGVNFAISVDTVKETVEQIIKYGSVQRAILGISYLERSPSRQESLKSGLPFVEKGVIVLDVPETSPVYSSGLRGIKKTSNNEERHMNKMLKLDSANIIQNILGDVIIGINNFEINNPNDLLATLDNFKPGDKVKLHILRGNSLTPITLDITLGSFGSSTFSGLKNEKNTTSMNTNIPQVPLDVPLENLAPQLPPKMPNK